MEITADPKLLVLAKDTPFLDNYHLIQQNHSYNDLQANIYQKATCASRPLQDCQEHPNTQVQLPTERSAL
jgi:hypothetical protein